MVGALHESSYDNMKTAVDAIFVGRERAYNRRFLQMCSHHLVDPVACRPASGWEKGQVEDQVGLVRKRFFSPRVRVPSRGLRLRVWCALYLLDSNNPVNSPADHGITGKLHGGGSEMRLIQKTVLGLGGWRLVEAIHPEMDVCRINEGHAAFAVLERARSLASRLGISFLEALLATRAGNVFTTHTPVAAGFDRFPLERSGDT